MKNRIISLLLAILMVVGMVPTVAFAAEDTAPSEITGIAITVDGVTYTEGDVIITPDSVITVTYFGNNLAQQSEGAIIDTPRTYLLLSKASAGANGEFHCQAYPEWFEGAVQYPITYTNDNKVTWHDSGITVTYGSNTPTAPVEITGLVLNVDGVPYTEGEVIIKPDSTVSFTVLGNNLQNGNLDAVIDTPGAYLPIHSLPLNENGEYIYPTEAWVFAGVKNYPITYTNDFWATTQQSGIYVTYDDGTAAESAEITGVSITVDGVTYTEGNVTITPNTKSVIYTVTGTNFANLTDNCFLWYTWDFAAPLLNESFVIDTVENTATLDLSADLLYHFESCDNFEIVYSNDLLATQIGTGIYLTYEKPAPDSTGKIVIDIADECADGWNGAAIEVYKNGTLETTATIEVGKDATVELVYDSTASYEFKWVAGSCDNECSFVIYVDGEIVLKRRSYEIDYENSETILTLAAKSEPESPALKITRQPADAEAKLGEEFCVTVEAQGEKLRYRWYYRKAGTEQWTSSGIRDNTYNDVMTKDRHNREVYCVITDAKGNSVTTDIATIRGIVTEELAIVTQPSCQEVTLGETFNVVFEAKGDGLKYQWYFRKAGTETWQTSQQRDNSYDDVMTKDRHNRELYCVVTDAWGNKVQTDPIVIILALPKDQLAIITQPNDASAKLGEEFCVTVEAQGDSLSYRWYHRKAGTEQWQPSGVRDNTYNDLMTSERHNREVYCVITDMWGNSVTTDIATIYGIPSQELTIVQQPNDASAKLNEEFCVTVKAQGEGLKYRWYYRKAGTMQWQPSGVRDNTYNDLMTSERHNREVYCVITDMWGNSVTTDIATIRGIPSQELAIVQQPTDVEVKMGEVFNVEVLAQGDSLKFAWYFRNKGASGWTKSGVTDNTYDDVMNRSRAGRQIYCVITDAWGNSVQTDVVTLNAVG